jgi:cobalamin biosynthesis protein CobD/CbiB
MNWLKVILIAIGIFIAIMLGFTVVGIVYSALWYLFWIGVIAVAGTVGYKMLKKSVTPQIENTEPIGISELKNADKSLEEYKQKYLSK